MAVEKRSARAPYTNCPGPSPAPRDLHIWRTPPFTYPASRFQQAPSSSVGGHPTAFAHRRCTVARRSCRQSAVAVRSLPIARLRVRSSISMLAPPSVRDGDCDHRRMIEASTNTSVAMISTHRARNSQNVLKPKMQSPYMWQTPDGEMIVSPFPRCSPQAGPGNRLLRPGKPGHIQPKNRSH